ncbi:MAG: excinuclease ABC subunit UvrB [Candidatus Pacebacteria bacterium]|nr:excinuclease ABC subunit UvrB [Candidatus Paceibacterota bacterium]
MKFKLKSNFSPTGDQPQAIQKLVEGLAKKLKHQVLRGVTGSGKTFTLASVIQKVQRPTLIISHNKTLAAQLYQEFRDFFPENAVGYFVSYYDYYQPEAYIPRTDTYIEKETDINQEIDKLRLKATSQLLSRKDVIIIASVSSIYNIGSPERYRRFVFKLKKGQEINLAGLLKQFIRLRYERTRFDLERGTFRVRGELVDVLPAYQDEGLRIGIENDRINFLMAIEAVTGRPIKKLENFTLYPAKHYLSEITPNSPIYDEIRSDLSRQIARFKKKNQILEAHRLQTRVNFDLEQIAEFGYVNGIENYSRYFDGRQAGDPPYSLLDYFPKNFLLIIDESHMTIPQIKGMHRGDQARKETLINYGFRLPAARDNRPLTFSEFQDRVFQTIYSSATPGPWELKKAGRIVEQLIRPTGIPDPQISLRPTKNQIADLMKEIKKRIRKHERVLVTTLTKKMAEALAGYLKEKGIKVHHLHSEINTLDRSDILDNLRLGKYDVVVGINLLREGLDLPEVSLVAILDADKEGFLRSETSLIQVMGRAARHVGGKVIMYADSQTGSMIRAMGEIRRRRQIQADYNLKQGITPESITKPVREKLIQREKEEKAKIFRKRKVYQQLDQIDPAQIFPGERKRVIQNLTRQMHRSAAALEFELAAEIRDKIRKIETF